MSTKLIDMHKAKDDDERTKKKRFGKACGRDNASEKRVRGRRE
jgi:hypothetical protein